MDYKQSTKKYFFISLKFMGLFVFLCCKNSKRKRIRACILKRLGQQYLLEPLRELRLGRMPDVSGTRREGFFNPSGGI
jgi:hypothetical protein